MKFRFSYAATAAIVGGLVATGASAGMITGIIADSGVSYEARPRYVTSDDPANHVVPAGGFSGVAGLIISRTDGTFLCSGSLLSSGRHILTAAHCVTNDTGAVTATGVSATFTLAGGDQTALGAAVTVHPGWNGQILVGNDLAIIELAADAPAAAQRYDIYRSTADVGAVGEKVGFGGSGTGGTGDTLPAGTKRSGQNKYDDLADTLLTAIGVSGLVPGSQLLYDFDNGLVANDAFDFFNLIVGPGLADLGLGVGEVSSAPGDSGGPTFIDGLIAGIASYGLRLRFGDGSTSDVDADLNSSFGEFSGDTRVTIYQEFIDSIVGHVTTVSEPATLLILGGALLMIGLLRRQDG